MARALPAILLASLALAAPARASDEDAAARAARAEAALARGIERLEKNDPAGALSDLALATELAPAHAEARVALAIAHFRLDDHARARPELEAALEREPRHAVALEYLGRIEYAAGRLDRALDRYRAALEADPKRPGLAELIEKVEREQKVEGTFTERYTLHFHMKLEGGRADAAIADRIADELERAYSEVGYALGHYPARTVPVILYADREFYQVTGMHGWVGGMFDGKIRLPIKDIFRSDGEAIRRIVAHEYSHACVYTLAPRCPTWLQEGIAQHFEGACSDPASLAAHREKLPGFSKLGETFTAVKDGESARVLYAQSLSFVEFLIARRGAPEIAALLRELGGGKPLEEAFERVYGATLATLEDEWRAGLW